MRQDLAELAIKTLVEALATPNPHDRSALLEETIRIHRRAVEDAAPDRDENFRVGGSPAILH